MAKEKDVVLANHHTGPVTLPRTYAANASGNPADLQRRMEMVTIQPGCTITISATEYEVRRQSKAFIYYLDNGILGVIKREGQVDVTNDSIIDTSLNAVASIAPHLLPDDEGNVTVQSAVDGSAIKAGIRKQTKGTVTV